MTRYRQDWNFTQFHKDYPDKGEFDNPIADVQHKLLDHVLKNGQKGNLKSAIDTIDAFCSDHWMMNLGPDKGHILKSVFQKFKPKRILEIGGYCGYSSLVFSYLTDATIHTVQIANQYAEIARKIHQFAGVSDRNHITIGTVETLQKQIKQRGPYDAIFIDHAKNIYLSDFLLLQKYGVIKKGTLVIGDNIIYPGPKGYLQHFKQRQDYDSTLYHSFVQYSNIKDAVLVSERLTQ